MFPYDEGLITALIRLRQAEIRCEFAYYHLAQAARAGLPSTPHRLAALVQRVRHRTAGPASLPAQRSAHANARDRCSA